MSKISDLEKNVATGFIKKPQEIKFDIKKGKKIFVKETKIKEEIIT